MPENFTNFKDTNCLCVKCDTEKHDFWKAEIIYSKKRQESEIFFYQIFNHLLIKKQMSQQQQKTLAED